MCISSPFITAPYKTWPPPATTTPLVQVAELLPQLLVSARMISSVHASIVVCDEFPLLLSRAREHTDLQSRVIKLQNAGIKAASGIPVQHFVHMPLDTLIATVPVPLCIKTLHFLSAMWQCLLHALWNSPRQQNLIESWCSLWRFSLYYQSASQMFASHLSHRWIIWRHS